MAGELRPGDLLPKETDLAARLGVSRNSLREAIRALTASCVVSMFRQGDGTYVTSLEPDVLLDSLGFVIDLVGDHVVELFELRQLLEPGHVARGGRMVP